MRLDPITLPQRPALEQLFQLYLHDMSEFLGWPVADSGRYELPGGLLDPYWYDSDHWPYFVLIENELAGFSLVRKAPGASDRFDMGQFFILRKFRQGNAAQSAFALSAERHRGAWQVRVLPDNTRAVRFWRKATKALARNGQVEEQLLLYGHNQMHHLLFQV
ncbi:Predicted acetyltransferase [Aliiroseovarius halocynthiae]|uniref:GNAT family N-acetyltransferase n=1 Tax=Aliiroseovarius halocynthiae TaxID=985055 RepID=A0A545SU08_9RHOB|nr:GNAT family N-acetyltransferase [Aliiroseovarius halocynthiae]TQV68437.1 GNAT family N-acetyltransferase [Aliiroseovarius halocynthiae]SMR70831.1 Predicted acetyltransferase [Aliiroseovarius halocynthiae]